MSPPKNPPSQEELEAALLKYLYSPPTTIDVIALSIQMTLKEFKAAWHQYHTERMDDWLMEQKLLVAKKMLSEGNSIGETALALGWTTINGINAPFIKHFGMTPGEYIKRIDGEMPINGRWVAANLKRIREGRSWDAKKAAAVLNDTISNYYYRESGRRTPTIQTVMFLAEALGVDIAELLKEIPIPPKKTKRTKTEIMAYKSLAETLSKNVKQLRRSKVLTVDDLAGKLRLPIWQVQQIEDATHPVTKELIEKLAITFNAPPSALVDGADIANDIVKYYDGYKGLSVEDIRMIEDDSAIDPDKLAEDARRMVERPKHHAPVPKAAEAPIEAVAIPEPAMPVIRRPEPVRAAVSQGTPAQLLIGYVNNKAAFMEIVEKLYKARLTDKIVDLGLYLQRKLLATVVAAYITDEDNKAKAVQLVKEMTGDDRSAFIAHYEEQYLKWKAKLFKEEDLALGVVIADNTKSAIALALSFDRDTALAGLLVPLITYATTAGGKVDMAQLSTAVGEWIEQLNTVQNAITEFIESKL